MWLPVFVLVQCASEMRLRSNKLHFFNHFFFNGKDIEYDFKSRWKKDIVSLTCALYRMVIEFSPWWCHPVPKKMISQDMNKPITHLCQKKGKQPTGRYLFFVFLFTFEGNLFFLIQDEISLFLFLFPLYPPPVSPLLWSPFIVALIIDLLIGCY